MVSSYWSCGPRIGKLRPAARDLAVGHRDIGAGDGLSRIASSAACCETMSAADQGLLAPVGVLLLRQHGSRLLEIGFGASDVDLRDEQGRLRLGELGLLLAGAEVSQHLSLHDAIAVVGRQFGQCSADLEAEPREHARLDRAEAEHTDRHIRFDGGHIDGQGPSRINKISPSEEGGGKAEPKRPSDPGPLQEQCDGACWLGSIRRQFHGPMSPQIYFTSLIQSGIAVIAVDQ